MTHKQDNILDTVDVDRTVMASSFVNLTQSRVLREENASLRLSVDKPMGLFLIPDGCGRA